MIFLEKHNLQWGKIFLTQKTHIIQNLPNCLEIYHIGSTAIVRILAKPIIDILAVVSDISQIGEIDGYKPHGEYGIIGRRYFTKSGINLHAFQGGAKEIADMRFFVEHLNTNPKTAKKYEKLKMNLAKNHNNTNEYANAKTEFINEILSLNI